MIFKFDVAWFRKLHLIRSGILLGIYLLVFFWNLAIIEETKRGEYLKIFVPVTILLVYFLWSNFRKQIKRIGDGYLDVSDKWIKQISESGSIDIPLREVKKINRDTFRLFPRLQLETDENIYSLINLNDMDGLTRAVEERTGLSATYTRENSKKHFIISFLPSIGTLLFAATRIVSWQLAGLVVNVNLLLFLLYRRGTQDNAGNRILFIALAAFIFQVWYYLSG